jgi:4-amino-4-deoxy-L-arabinose transferase-like glycosyltransferase
VERPPGPEPSPRAEGRLLWTAAGLGLLALVAVAAWADTATGWFATAFHFVAHLFYEKSALAEIRAPSQLELARAHFFILTPALAAGLIAAPWLTSHLRRFWAVLCLGYAIRAAFWIAGGNLPLVPGDCCHYVEVATSVYRGQGPVKHYVESYFLDYRKHGILDGRGVLDDWATPLWAYVLAAAYRLTGVVPGASPDATFAVAKGTSFALNLLTLPLFYVFARRRFGARVALGATAILAVLPVHALYAGFALRESLVVLTALLAVWFLTEIGPARPAAAWAWALAAGLGGGLAIVARNTGLVLFGASWLAAVVLHGWRRLGPHLLAALVVLLVIAPWAWATYREYGEPFFTYTKYFAYNFSWTVHHYETGNTRAAQFFTAENLPSIARIKFKSVLIVGLYSTMMLSLPLALLYARRLFRPGADRRGRDLDRMIAFAALAFVAATLIQVADVTQVQQLGRYYLPVYLLMLPTAAAGLGDWLRSTLAPGRWAAVAATIIACLWADPSWAYDAGWPLRPYQLHWPALRAAGDWIREHPEQVPPDARILTWFPWELRVVGDRTTILLPRNYSPAAIAGAIDRYAVTHVLWGSFEPPPDIDPETWGPYLERLRVGLGLSDDRLLYRSPGTLPYPVRLYRLGGGRR